MLAIRAGIHKMLVIMANREDPDQTASSENQNIRLEYSAVRCSFENYLISTCITQ